MLYITSDKLAVAKASKSQFKKAFKTLQRDKGGL